MTDAVAKRVDELLAELDVKFAPVGAEILDLLHNMPPHVALFIVLRQAVAGVLAQMHPSLRIDCAASLADEIIQDARDSLQ